MIFFYDPILGLAAGAVPVAVPVAMLNSGCPGDTQKASPGSVRTLRVRCASRTDPDGGGVE